MDQLLIFLSLGQFYSILAISTCSHSFAYRQLCPNPMFVTRNGGGSVPDSDLSINLRNSGYSRNTNHLPSSCDFFKDKNDMSIISGIHVSDQQWPFRGASTCNHVVKFLVDPDRNGNSGPPICKKEIGMRVLNLNEDYRWNVYLWHNFTLGSYQANFADSITNYGYSESDVACTSKPQFVQIIILTSKNLKCSLLVQQYRIDKFRRGCDSIQTEVPSIQFQFCGAYQCSELNNIVQELKLTSRHHPLEPHVDVYPDENDLKHHQHHKHSGPKSHSEESEEEEVGVVVDVQESTTLSPDSESDEIVEKEINWNEWSVRLFFPAFGVAFIFFLLSILRGSYAKQICRRGDFGGQYHGSTLSMDKEGLHL